MRLLVQEPMNTRSIFASVIGFTTYLMLVSQIGSAQAGYATVMFPIVALAVSTVFEGYVWTPTAMLGAGLALLGNVVMFAQPRRRRPAAAPPGAA